VITACSPWTRVCYRRAPGQRPGAGMRLYDFDLRWRVRRVVEVLELDPTARRRVDQRRPEAAERLGPVPWRDARTRFFRRPTMRRVAAFGCLSVRGPRRDG